MVYSAPRWAGARFYSAAGGEATFWSLSRHDWGDLHDWVAVALLVVVIIHIILHWKWIFPYDQILLNGKTQDADLERGR